MPALVGCGYRFSSLIAFASKRPLAAAAARLFRPQVASVNVVVLAGQVPKGSRTKPVFNAVIPDVVSTTPAVAARVVAGSRMVPTGIDRPRLSVLGALLD